MDTVMHGSAQGIQEQISCTAPYGTLIMRATETLLKLQARGIGTSMSTVDSWVKYRGRVHNTEDRILHSRKWAQQTIVEH